MNVYVRELGRALAARGVAVDIFTRRQATDVPDVVEYAPGARVIHIDAGPHRHVDKYDVLDYLPDFACGVQRFRALTGASYDVIHSHYWLSGRLGLLFADHWGVPLVSTFHTLAQLKNRVAEIGRRTRAGGALRDRAAHDGRLGSHRGADGDRPPADDAPLRRRRRRSRSSRAASTSSTSARGRGRRRGRRSGCRRARRCMLFVGRIQRLKGLEVLLRAFARLSDLDARLLIVGGQPGHEPRVARDRAAAAPGRRGSASPSGRTLSAPWRTSELPLYYSAADVTVMPSSYESFGLVAVESLACGTPVVATRVGGLRVDRARRRDRAAGAVARRGRCSPNACGGCSRTSRCGSGWRARRAQSVLEYGWDRIADEHLALYEEVRRREARKPPPVARRQASRPPARHGVSASEAARLTADADLAARGELSRALKRAALRRALCRGSAGA